MSSEEAPSWKQGRICEKERSSRKSCHVSSEEIDCFEETGGLVAGDEGEIDL